MRRVGELVKKSTPVSGSKNFTKSRDEKVDAWDERIARAESTLCCHTLGGKRHIFEKTNNVTYILSQTSQTIFFRLQKIKSFSKIFFEKILQKCLKNLFFLWKNAENWKKKLLISCTRFSRKCGPDPTKTGRNRPKPYETITKPSRNRRKSHECMQTMPRNQFCALAGI